MEEDSKNMYSGEDNDLMSSFCVEISKEEHQFLQILSIVLEGIPAKYVFLF